MRKLGYLAVFLLGLFLRDLIDPQSTTPVTETKINSVLRPASAITEMPKSEPFGLSLGITGCEFEREQIGHLLDELERIERFVYRPDSLYRSTSPFVHVVNARRRTGQREVQW